jgi:hypothetical protein
MPKGKEEALKMLQEMSAVLVGWSFKIVSLKVSGLKCVRIFWVADKVTSFIKL